MHFESAKTSKTLQAILTTPETFIQFHKKKEIARIFGEPIYELPTYFYVTSEREIMKININLDYEFFARIDDNMQVRFESSWSKNSVMLQFLDIFRIKSIKIDDNVVWIEKADGTYIKLNYMMVDRQILDPHWHLMDFFTEVIPVPDKAKKTHTRMRPVSARAKVKLK